MPEIVKYARPEGFFKTFERRPGTNKTNMHYCPGCGHGILHKLIAEAIGDFGIKDRAVIVCPVGCAVFAYYYFDCRAIECSHGRAPAVATAFSRTDQENVVIGYQGDGDLASIGFNHILQAANRGENMTVFFVNNAIYGMTGGQMAPTTLIGQKTQTSPLGRSVLDTGYPVKVCEMLATLESPVYIERCALSSVKNIMAARRAVRKAIQNTIDKKGFSFVEFLSGCPVNLKLKAREMNEFLDTKMSKIFPLGVYKDIADTRAPMVRALPEFDPEKLRAVLYPSTGASSAEDDSFRFQSPVFDKERSVKICGFGGQGVLSLGHVLATVGKIRNFHVSWLPSYGPEMRGGTANCSVVFSRGAIGSPQADYNCSMIVCLNQPSVDKFLGQLGEGGVLIYDSSTITLPEISADKTVYGVNAGEIAEGLGDLRVANSIILGVISRMMQECFLNEDEKADVDLAMEEALRENFARKPAVLELNLKAYQIGKTTKIIRSGARVS